MTHRNCEDLFDDWLRASESGEIPDFDSLCGAHPECAESLRKLHSEWRRMESLLHTNETTTPVSNGDQVQDPGLRLIPPSAGETETTSLPLLNRIDKRGPPRGRFIVKERIGWGGMGEVFRVYDSEIGRHVAAKVLRLNDPTYLPRFLEEAQVTGQLDHPAFIPVHDFAVDENGRVFFTMKLVKGVGEEANAPTPAETFADVIGKIHGGSGEWSLTRGISDVIVRVAEAMEFAHAKGVVHRDLKPSNILVGRYGEVYVTDFGIARVHGKERANVPTSSIPLTFIQTERRESIERNLVTPQTVENPISPGPTQEGSTIGTPEYMPREQAEGRLAEIGPSSDIYALGATLYHLIAGVPPWHSPTDHPTPGVIVRRIIAGSRPEPLHELAPNTPAELIAIVEKAMAKLPRERYRSMQEFAVDLRDYLGTRVVSAYETGTVAKLKKWVQRNPELAAAAAVLMLVFATATTIVLKTNANLDQKRSELIDARDAFSKQKTETVAQQLIADAKIFGFSEFELRNKLEKTIKKESELYPAWPEKISAMEDWLENEASVILELETDIDNLLERIRAQSNPWKEGELSQVREQDPQQVKLTEIENFIKYCEYLTSGPHAIPDEIRKRANELSEKNAHEIFEIAVRDMKPSEQSIQYALAAAELAARKVEDGDQSLSGEFDSHESQVFYAQCLVAIFKLWNGHDHEWEDFHQELQDTLREQHRASAPPPTDQRTIDIQEMFTLEFGNYSIGPYRMAMDRYRLVASALKSELKSKYQLRFSNKILETTHQSAMSLFYEIQRLAKLSHRVEQRLQWARRIQELTLRHPRARVTWDQARDAIAHADGVTASRLYATAPRQPIELTPQTGLVPIGMNPNTKLWEFYDLRSACDVGSGEDPATIEIPQHQADGSLRVEDNTGIIFVFLPGGDVSLGSQAIDPREPDYDPEATESDNITITALDPFFIARHELTVGQWLRLTSDRDHAEVETADFEPTDFIGLTWFDDPIPWGMTHPWPDPDASEMDTSLQNNGMSLPTVAQWEYGARAATSTPWWTGASATSLAASENVLDLQFASLFRSFGEPEGEFRDGFVSVSPVATFRANPFGLFDVLGNVPELCRPLARASNDVPTPPPPSLTRSPFGQSEGKPLIPRFRVSDQPDLALEPVLRGGGYWTPASRAKATSSRSLKENSDWPFGVRPTRRLINRQ